METAPVRYAVVDTETSGLSADRHRLLQVGVVVVDADGEVLTRWSSLVRPRRRWFYRVGPTRIHGIHRRDVRHAPPAAEVVRRVAELLHGARFVAHNSDFDVAFLERAAAREGVVLPIVEPLCTLRLSRRLDPERQLSHRLGDVADRYDVALLRPHDALADAEATAAILPHLLRAHAALVADAELAAEMVQPAVTPLA
ncbi:MAG: exonuclease domain-containing protein [Ilumatobacteraceae bacterium]